MAQEFAYDQRNVSELETLKRDTEQFLLMKKDAISRIKGYLDRLEKVADSLQRSSNILKSYIK
jgi:hypothetical protein